MFPSLRAYSLAIARATDGGWALELPGVTAAIAPALPERSVVNCVVYDGADALKGQLDLIADEYDQSGVRAWTVWVHESDRHARSLLEAAGHVLDAEPMAQGRELADLDPPEEELDLVPDPTPADFDPVIERSYGWPGFGSALREFPPEFHPYLARNEGEPACCLATIDHDGDTAVTFVGTVPEARGRGLATRLMRRALADARDRGATTTTLQATRLGYPVYARVGYRDFGRVEMWERRKPAPTS
jgi:GNAT superfamily N-acetyltransferase